MKQVNATKNKLLQLELVLVVGLIGNTVLEAVSFSTDTASATVPPDTIFSPGPVPVLPGTAPPAEVDAFSYGHTAWDDSLIFFSVNHGSMGLPGSAVSIEAAVPGDEAADIYASTLGGTNTQIWDGDGSSAPPLMLIEGATDNVDGLDMRAAPPPAGAGIYFSVDTATATGHPVYAGTSGSDIWFSPAVAGYSGTPALFTPAAGLGLVTADEVDALAIIDDGLAGFTAGDLVLYSLAPGSPSLATIAGGISPADVLAITTTSGPPVVAFPAGALGLLPTDDLNALDVNVPEPGATALLLSVIVMVGALIRRRSSGHR